MKCIICKEPLRRNDLVYRLETGVMTADNGKNYAETNGDNKMHVKCFMTNGMVGRDETSRKLGYYRNYLFRVKTTINQLVSEQDMGEEIRSLSRDMNEESVKWYDNEG